MDVVNRWKSEVTRKINVTVGRTAIELLGECYTYECNIGNLIADAFVYYVSNFRFESLKFNSLIENVFFRTYRQ